MVSISKVYTTLIWMMHVLLSISISVILSMDAVTKLRRNLETCTKFFLFLLTGIKVIGGVKELTGDEFGVYVKRILPGGLAAADGRSCSEPLLLYLIVNFSKRKN